MLDACWHNFPSLGVGHCVEAGLESLLSLQNVWVGAHLPSLEHFPGRLDVFSIHEAMHDERHWTHLVLQEGPNYDEYSARLMDPEP